MSADQISALRTELNGALLDFAWGEWAQLGVFAAAGPPSPWAQDPEALLLLTLEVARNDPRLFDEVLDWIIVNEPLLSIRRLRALAVDDEDQRLLDAALGFAARHRPRARLSPRPRPAPTHLEGLYHGLSFPIDDPDPAFAEAGFLRPTASPTGKSRAPDLLAPVNLAFRLRQLLGVGVRSELVRTLLTIDAPRASAGVITNATAFTQRNVQETLTALHLAGVVTIVSAGSDRRYGLERERWAGLLGLESDGLPAHRDWPQLFRAVRRTLRWIESVDPASTDYLIGSGARALLATVSDDLRYAGVPAAATPTAADAVDALTDAIRAALQLLRPPAAVDGDDVGPTSTVVVARDADAGWRWTMCGPGGAALAHGPTTYATRAAAEAAAAAFRDRLTSVRFDVYRTGESSFRWRARSTSGDIVAESGEAASTRAQAQRSADHVRASAVDPTRRHVSRRDDGWEVRIEGRSRASSIHPTQAAATEAARAMSVRGGGEVIVHGADGQIRSAGTRGGSSRSGDRTARPKK